MDIAYKVFIATYAAVCYLYAFGRIAMSDTSIKRRDIPWLITAPLWCILLILNNAFGGTKIN